MAKRVLVYTNHYFPEQFKVNDLVSWIKSKQLDITIVTGIPNYPKGKFYPGYGLFKNNFEFKLRYKVYRLPLIPRGDGSKLIRLLNYFTFFISSLLFTFYILIFKKKYDYVITHHTSPIFIGIHSIFHKIFKNSKCIFWELDLWPESLIELKIINKGFVSKFISTIVKYIYRFNDYILISSNGFKDKIEKIVSSKKVIYFPNWADKIIEDYSLENLNFINNSNNDPLKIYYTGNIGEAQGFEKIIEILISLKNENICWYFIGDGSFKKNLEEKIVVNGLDKVFLIDHQEIEKMLEMISDADLLLVLLKDNQLFNNTVPAKLQSYMCIGKPIIGLISGESKKIIEDAECGFAFPANNKKDFIQKILFVEKQQKSFLIKLGQNGRKYYLDKFRSSKRKKEILGLLNN